MNQLSLPDKKYKVIYVDPPWPVKKIQRDVRPNQISMDYPVMSLIEIASMSIQNISDNNCVCFLWSIQKYLREALNILEGWGFKYHITITWDKQNGMCLGGFHRRTELLLFGYKGKLDMFPERKAFPTMVQCKTDKHSRKPQAFRDLIAPFGSPRIELFARERVPGWDAWGNEV